MKLLKVYRNPTGEKIYHNNIKEKAVNHAFHSLFLFQLQLFGKQTNPCRIQAEAEQLGGNFRYHYFKDDEPKRYALRLNLADGTPLF